MDNIGTKGPKEKKLTRPGVEGLLQTLPRDSEGSHSIEILQPASAISSQIMSTRLGVLTANTGDNRFDPNEKDVLSMGDICD